MRGALAWLFSFRGRIARRGFWLRLVALGVLASVLVVALGLYIEVNGGVTEPLAFKMAVIAVYGVTLLGLASVLCCRFHDHDRSGWWALACLVVPIVPAIALDVARLLGASVSPMAVNVTVAAIVPLSARS